MVMEEIIQHGAQIAGKWNIDRIVSTCYTDGVETDQLEDIAFTGQGAYAQYNPDGTGRINDKEYDYTFTYTVTGTTIYMTNFDFDGDGHIETEPDEMPSEFTITRLTAHELVTQAEVTLHLLGHVYRSVQEMYMKR